MAIKTTKIVVLNKVKEEMEKKKKKKRARLMEDRLNNLPQSLQLHILSFLETRLAIQTSALSKPWISLWASTPALNLNSFAFNRLYAFDRFVYKVLRLRDQSAKLNKLTFTRRGVCSAKILKKVVNYAISHGVGEMELYIEDTKLGEWPVFLPSDSLTKLKLGKLRYMTSNFPPNVERFKNLTLLDLDRIYITHIDMKTIEGLAMLEKLRLYMCDAGRDRSLIVSAPNLTHLTIEYGYFGGFEIITPNLRFFEYKGSNIPLFKTNLPVLDTVCFGIYDAKIMFDDLISVFSAFYNVKSLTLSHPNIIACLSYNNLANLDSPFRHLKLLKFHMNSILQTIPFEVKAYLCNNGNVSIIYT